MIEGPRGVSTKPAELRSFERSDSRELADDSGGRGRDNPLAEALSDASKDEPGAKRQRAGPFDSTLLESGRLICLRGLDHLHGSSSRSRLCRRRALTSESP
jgi:hypothetical protein